MTLLLDDYPKTYGNAYVADHIASPQAVISNREKNGEERYGKIPYLEEIEVSIDPHNQVVWSYYKHKSRACFTSSLLEDVYRVHSIFSSLMVSDKDEKRFPVKWFVQASKTPGVFSYGGDLSLFAHLIRTGNRDGLSMYAQTCVKLVYDLSVGFNLPILTVALLQGDALGGGFENALSCDFIVAERQTRIGLPETMFNLFPGMGAYSFLFRRVGHRIAQDLICGGKIHTAEELYELGIIDVLVEKGEGKEAVTKFINDNKKKHDFYLSMREVQGAVTPVTLDELIKVVNIWVDSAFRLTESDIRKMERIAYLQTKK